MSTCVRSLSFRGTEMAENLRDILKSAAREGLLRDEQVSPLAAFMEARNVSSIADVADDVANPDEDSEVPRFIRGYHDVLITIGILITLIGLIGLTNALVSLAAIIVLAEIFVRVQRLALPAFALTIGFAINIGFLLFALLDDGKWLQAYGEQQMTVVAACEFALLSLYYWRYRVPLAFSSLIAAGVGAVVGLVLMFIVQDNELFVTALYGISGLILSIVAIRYDLTDPARKSRRSDIAFWLHLIAVPAMLKTAFDVLAPTDGTVNAALMVAVVLAMMLLGMLLDRRAFVTAGLIYLGYAISTLLTLHTGGWFNALGNSQILWLLLVLGLVVLVVGFAWRHLRRVIIAALPGSVRSRLPVIR